MTWPSTTTDLQSAENGWSEATARQRAYAVRIWPLSTTAYVVASLVVPQSAVMTTSAGNSAGIGVQGTPEHCGTGRMTWPPLSTTRRHMPEVGSWPAASNDHSGALAQSTIAGAASTMPRHLPWLRKTPLCGTTVRSADDRRR